MDTFLQPVRVRLRLRVRVRARVMDGHLLAAG